MTEPVTICSTATNICAVCRDDVAFLDATWIEIYRAGDLGFALAVCPRCVPADKTAREFTDTLRESWERQCQPRR